MELRGGAAGARTGEGKKEIFEGKSEELSEAEVKGGAGGAAKTSGGGGGEGKWGLGGVPGRGGGCGKSGA